LARKQYGSTPVKISFNRAHLKWAAEQSIRTASRHIGISALSRADMLRSS
jgi:hypothetical protein